MKSVSKSELARMAGVSYRTFQRWLARHRDELQEKGISERTQILSSDAARWICKQYGIDIE